MHLLLVCPHSTSLEARHPAFRPSDPRVCYSLAQLGTLPCRYPFIHDRLTLSFSAVTLSVPAFFSLSHSSTLFPKFRDLHPRPSSPTAGPECDTADRHRPEANLLQKDQSPFGAPICSASSFFPSSTHTTASNMALPPFILFLIATLCVLITSVVLDWRKKKRLPDGAKPLPGPKGMSTSPPSSHHHPHQPPCPPHQLPS